MRVTVATILRLNILHCTEYMTCFPSLGRLRYFRNRMESSNWITKTEAERRLQKNTIQVTNIQNSVQHDKVYVAWYWQFLFILIFQFLERHLVVNTSLLTFFFSRVHIRYCIIIMLMFMITWLVGILLITYYWKALLCVLFIICCVITVSEVKFSSGLRLSIVP